MTFMSAFAPFLSGLGGTMQAPAGSPTSGDYRGVNVVGPAGGAQNELGMLLQYSMAPNANGGSMNNSKPPNILMGSLERVPETVRPWLIPLLVSGGLVAAALLMRGKSPPPPTPAPPEPPKA